jgi:hypothetical protein
MRRAVLPLLILATVVVAAALAWWTLNRSAAPSGDLTTQPKAWPPGSRRAVGGTADIILVQGDHEDVVIEAPLRSLAVRAQVDGQTLNIEAQNTRRWWGFLFGSGGGSGRAPQVTVHFKRLDAIDLSGAVRVTADRFESPQLRISASGGSTVRIEDLAVDILRVAGSGALKAELAGRAPIQHVAISGAGQYRAEKLVSDDVRVSVSGVGHVIVHADKTLHAAISGAGNVEYFGNPEVKESVTGIGRVKHREAQAVGGGWVAGRDGGAVTATTDPAGLRPT